MAIPLYLALTAAEFEAIGVLPERTAWMACHFSPYARGLSNLPEKLPEGSMIILNDRTPVCGHDPSIVAAQLAEAAQKCRANVLLLDFQRPGYEELGQIAEAVIEAAPCPVGVTELYAGPLPCPVFISPVPPDRDLEKHLENWAGREIWLDCATEEICLQLTVDGCTQIPEKAQRSLPFYDEKLCTHYCVKLGQKDARIFMRREKEDLSALLEQAERLGVTRAVGLWQELG